MQVIARTDFGRTEADLVQALYGELHPVLGYDSINLHVLEREGWYHSRAIDRGRLLDTRRRLLVESFFADYYRDPKPRVVNPPAIANRHRPRVLVWLPVRHNGRIVGSVSYQSYASRDITPEEISLLEVVHERLGVFVSNAYVNELDWDDTRTGSRVGYFSARLLGWLSVLLPSTVQARFVAEELGNLGGLPWWQCADHLGGLALGMPRLAWMLHRESRSDQVR